jgi:hypothetical protein
VSSGEKPKRILATMVERMQHRPLPFETAAITTTNSMNALDANIIKYHRTCYNTGTLVCGLFEWKGIEQEIR